ncbi:uncharacterized protein FFNC_15490 [Fusarium fujikuroi]|nr:uncharacterized protein FFNC_15490 [Fusarium fujikuroi]
MPASLISIKYTA